MLLLFVSPTATCLGMKRKRRCKSTAFFAIMQELY